MSDFLTNLVMRSFAQTPSVQPVTLSTYAAPEPQIETDPVEHVIEPVQVRNTNQREVVMKDLPPVETRPSPPEHVEKNPELHHEEVTQKSVVLEEPRVMSAPDQTIAPPVQPPQQRIVKPVQPPQKRIVKQPAPDNTIALPGQPPQERVLKPVAANNTIALPREPPQERVLKPVAPNNPIALPGQPPQQRIVKSPVQVQKVAEPLVVEQVIEHVVERPTVRSIERPTVRTIERPTITTVEQSTIETIDRPSLTSVERSSIERSIEQSSITIENTEHVTNSFTTLVPKVTPQSLPARNPKSRGIASPPEIPIEEQQQTPTASPETVVNVAIGRIEVRTTPAPAPRRERAPGPKVMTLDDYAQQRSRGAQ